MKSALRENWNNLLVKLGSEYGISYVALDAWIKPLVVHDVTEDTVYLMVEDKQSIEHLTNKFKKPLQTVISEFLIEKFEIKAKLFEIEFITKEMLENSSSTGDNQNDNQDAYNNSNINKKLTFENFIAGSNSRMAYAACQAVSESPGNVYNPLFIYADAGLGKTHLLHAIGNEFIKNHPNKKVMYTTCENFSSELIRYIKEKKNMDVFRNKYRNPDILLIDDIQFIVGKGSTEEEFFHTFNDILGNNNQIVIASDKAPSTFNNLDERFTSRFEMGLITEISRPDYETRMAILTSNMEKEKCSFKENVLDYIATNVDENIRTLNGALKKLIAFTALETDTEITLELAENILKDYISPNAPKVLTPEQIINIVCAHFDVTIDELLSEKRNEYVNTPRQIAMYLCRRYTNVTQVELANILKRKDHTTIANGERKIEKKINDDPSFKSKIDVLVQIINP